MYDGNAIATALAQQPGAVLQFKPLPPIRFEERLRHAQKMDALGQITGGIAHDFNNLLLAINFNLESLAEEVPPGPSTCSLFDGARQAIDQAHSLIGHLLTFARRQPLSPTTFDVNQAVRATQLMMRRAVPATIEIETRLGRNCGLLLADRNQFETALINLALNARDAMPEGGRLTIGSADVTFDAAYAALHPGVAAGRYVLVAVSDTGQGMTADVVERVFDPFFTTKSGTEHSGLGLSQVYGFARQSGGQARVDSEPGCGTTVQLFLPRFGDTPPIVRQTPPLARGNGETVLVVEDAPLVRTAVAKMVADLGYRPIAAESAEAALPILEDNGRIDLLFTDMVLPGGLCGEELAGLARRRRPGLAVLYTSGYTEMRLPAGFDADCRAGFVGKPYNKAELAAQLRALLDAAPAGAD
ncbi:MAG: response regulator [Alphaproteobacteria bacterium]|nr:response regulator [Alphaproteobacteria bacterium]